MSYAAVNNKFSLIRRVQRGKKEQVEKNSKREFKTGAVVENLFDSSRLSNENWCIFEIILKLFNSLFSPYFFASFRGLCIRNARPSGC